MRRKILAVLALAAAGMLILTACTSSGTGDTGRDQTSAPDTDAVQTEGAADTEKTEKETEKEMGKGTEKTADEKNEQETAKTEPEASEKGEDIWTGSYAGDQESVSVTMNEDGTITFSFAQSGISGTAEVDGSQAVYNGDDDHILTFSKDQGMLKVTVSHAEGYDTSASPLNGTYVPSY